MSLATSPIQWAILAASFASTVVGLYVAYQAYRGYRRHQSRPMQYLSLGLVILMGVTFASAFVGSLLLRGGVVPNDYRPGFTLLVRLLQLLGVAFIAYSLSLRA
ncbi:hypothetical protein [Halostella sp. PRR32]|uniref:DUF7521 family protein n=2 Tax=Halobacteriales TaxID=2235 RepID=UPI002B1D5017|nr:hypothetical protein [Halostella sp. PRR32]